jgi:hypothetical protein
MGLIGRRIAAKPRQILPAQENFMRALIFAVALAAAAGPAFAQSERNASDASGQTSLALGAIGESGLKATAGVVAVPLGVGGGVASGAGAASSAAGAPLLGMGPVLIGSAALDSAKGLSDFAAKPLSIGKEVVVGLAPQPAPKVPYTPNAKAPGQ